MDDIRQRHLFDLFATPGWRLVMQEMEEARDVLVTTTHLLNTEAELHRRKGEINQLDILIAYEPVFRVQVEEEERAKEMDRAEAV